MKSLLLRKTSVSIRNIKQRKTDALSFEKLLEMKGSIISQDLLLKEFKNLSYKLKCYLEYTAFDNSNELMEMNTAEFLRIHPEISSSMVQRTLNHFLKQECLKTEYQTNLKQENGQADLRKLGHETPPVLPKNAEIKYHFEVNFLQTGQINKDGSIDFREMGECPFVTDKTLLAEKIEPVPGKPGIDVYGNTISVPEAEDCLFESGTNTRFSEDRLKIYATADGQPHLDAMMGTVSVCSELRIDGDVDHDTGNINFKGNIIVCGAVNKGFSVKCANLTVDQINGAEIDITGNLNVSSGIIDSNVINIQGNVQAKYINNSKVKAFENIIVQKEIIDSQLFAGGECVNENGLITSSLINAKRGIRAVRVGTNRTAASRFEVGTKGLMEMLIAELDENVEKNLAEMKMLKQKIHEYEREEKLLCEKISIAAHAQDRSQIEFLKLQKLLPELQESKDVVEVQKSLDMVKDLQEQTTKAEDTINYAFERQDAIVEFIYTRQSKIEKLEQSNEAIVHKKNAIKAYNRKSEPRAEVIVRKSIIHDTIISGKRSRLVVKEELQRCKIHEVRTVDKTRYVMRISEL